MAVGPLVASPPPFIISLFGQELNQKSFEVQGSPTPGETTVSDEQKRLVIVLLILRIKDRD
jgi:hypothetical protein